LLLVALNLKASIVSAKNGKSLESHYFFSDGQEDRASDSSINSIPPAYPQMPSSGYLPNFEVAILKDNKCVIFIKMSEHSFAAAQKQNCKP
jgi:hypothetical protein